MLKYYTFFYKEISIKYRIYILIYAKTVKFTVLFLYITVFGMIRILWLD